jgi:3-oxoacyl-[acyl-carrier protein] reductase
MDGLLRRCAPRNDDSVRTSRAPERRAFYEEMNAMGRGTNGRLAGKVALIVGGARGIGAGIAERFHEEGAQVVIADTELEAGAATAERLKGKFVATDISKPADAERAVAGALAAFGDLHIVVQNAGVYPW